MKFSSLSVLGGWQTQVEFLDGTTTTVGPVFNDCLALWAWQRVNLRIA